MGCQTCYLDAVNVNASGIIVESFELPDAVKSDAGLTLDQAGIDNELYADAPFRITWVLTGSATTQAASMNALTRACVPGAVLMWKESGMSASLSTVLRTVQPGGVEYNVGFARATFTGTRDAAWERNTYDGSASVQPDWVGTGQLYYDGSAVTVAGEISARPSVRYIVNGSCSSIGVAFSTWNASTTPIFNFSGTVEANADGGESSCATVSSSAWTAQGSAELARVADAGRKLVYVRAKGKLTTQYKVCGRLVGNAISASATVDSDPAFLTQSGVYDVIALGPITVPCSTSLSGMYPTAQLMVKDTSSSGDVYLDHVTLFPLEHAVIVDTTTANAQGIVINDAVAYLCDSDGEAPISQEGVEFYGVWGIPTGQVRWTTVSKPVDDAAPPTVGALTISWTERFIHRA